VFLLVSTFMGLTMKHEREGVKGSTLPLVRRVALPVTTTTTPDLVPYFCDKLPESGWDSDAFCLCLSRIPAKPRCRPSTLVDLNSPR